MIKEMKDVANRLSDILMLPKIKEFIVLCSAAMVIVMVYAFGGFGD